MFMPSKRQMRLRANLIKSIGFLSGPALLVPWPGSQNVFVRNFQGLRLLPWSHRRLDARSANWPVTAARASAHIDAIGGEQFFSREQWENKTCYPLRHSTLFPARQLSV